MQGTPFVNEPQGPGRYLTCYFPVLNSHGDLVFSVISMKMWRAVVLIKHRHNHAEKT